MRTARSSLSLCIFASLLATLLAAPVPNTQGTEVGQLRLVSAGRHVLNTIAVRRLSQRLQGNSSGNVLTPQFGEGADHLPKWGNLSAWGALNMTCENHAFLSAIYDMPASHQDKSFHVIKISTEHMMQSFCRMTEALFRLTYPSSTFAFTCSTQEMEKICQDLRTVQYSHDLHESIAHHQEEASRGFDTDQWVEQNIQQRALVPEAFRLINETRTLV